MEIVKHDFKKIAGLFVILICACLSSCTNWDLEDKQIQVSQDHLKSLREQVDFYGKILKDPDIWLETNSTYILPVWMHREKAVRYLRGSYLTELRAQGKSFDENEFTNRIERFRNNSDEAKNELRDIIKIIQSDIDKLEKDSNFNFEHIRDKKK